MTVPATRYQVSTFGPETPGTFKLLGKKVGHGVASWEPAEREDLGEPPEWIEPVGVRRPVIAILDSGVFTDHPWLPDRNLEDKFVTEETDWGQQKPVVDLSDEGELPDLGSHLGHGTFVAGIIRKVAPTARIRSFKVMDTSGTVEDENVLSALTFLNHDPADVVLMAFGRKVENGDDDSEAARKIKDAIRGLAGKNVRVVMSAGNGRSADPVFPACSARFTGDRVVSVGGGMSRYLKEEYSSWGHWVTDWRIGGDVVSLMPMVPAAVGEAVDPMAGGGYAKWSGSSFSAARFAAEYAAGLQLPPE
jgi:subtilisin family serine protease